MNRCHFAVYGPYFAINECCLVPDVTFFITDPHSLGTNPGDFAADGIPIATNRVSLKGNARWSKEYAGVSRTALTCFEGFLIHFRVSFHWLLYDTPFAKADEFGFALFINRL